MLPVQQMRGFAVGKFAVSVVESTWSFEMRSKYSDASLGCRSCPKPDSDRYTVHYVSTHQVDMLWSLH